MENGGYMDRNVAQDDKTLRIKVDGIAGGLNAMR
jgi:hypothetical protein